MINPDMPDVIYAYKLELDNNATEYGWSKREMDGCIKYIRTDKAIPEGYALVPIDALKVIEKFIKARNMTIDFLPEKTHENLSLWINHFVHCVNYSLSFNDWMRLDSIIAAAQKGEK